MKYYQKGDSSLLILVCFCSIAITLVLAGSSVSKKQTSYTDSEILKARMFIVDYQHRLDEAAKRLEKCNDKGSLEMQLMNENFYRDCRASVYDTVGLEYNSSKELSLNSKNKFIDYKEIALFPLSTEK